MTLRTRPQTAGALATTMSAALFSAGLVAGAAPGCAPAAAPLDVVGPVAPAAAQSNVPTLCATPTTKDQDLAGAHAAVREALVSNKKVAITAVHTLSVEPQGPRPDDAENVDETKKAEADKAAEAESAKLDAALAAVDAEESHGKGTASDQATRIELGGDAVAYFFTGGIANTCRCGSGYNPGWGILVVKNGCGWKRVGGDFTSDSLQKLRAPSGAPVLVQTHDGDPSLYQCGGAETRLFLVQSATEVFDLRIPASSEKSPCDGKGPRAELTIEQGTLTGARLVSNTADTPEVEEKWTETAHVGFAKGQYIMYQAGK